VAKWAPVVSTTVIPTRSMLGLRTAARIIVADGSGSVAGRRTGTTSAVTAAMSTNATAATPNGSRQLVAAPRAVAAGSPSESATALPAATVPAARPRRSRATTARAIRNTAVKMIACAAPPSSRAATASARVVLAATSALLRAKTTSMASRTARAS